MSYKISIIMPIYNAEKYLERTIQSIINQNIGFENIELILVDDNSTDSSDKIIQRYAERYENIIPIFLEKNSGWASTPRNEGINKSTSNYLMFIDSDDEYNDDLCERFYNTIITEEADLVSCNYISTDHISQTKTKLDFNFENFTPTDDKIIITGDEVIEFDNIFVWNKIFKKSLIVENNISFKELMSEDFIFCIEYLLKSNKRVYLYDYYGYQKYPQNKSLSTDNISLTSTYNHIKVDEIVLDLIKQNIRNPSRLDEILNIIFKIPIQWVLEEGITIKNQEDIKKGLKALYLFEKKIQFKSNLDNAFLNMINKLLLKKKCTLLLIIFRLSRLLFNSNFSRKIYRKISK